MAVSSPRKRRGESPASGGGNRKRSTSNTRNLKQNAKNDTDDNTQTNDSAANTNDSIPIVGGFFLPRHILKRFLAMTVVFIGCSYWYATDGGQKSLSLTGWIRNLPDNHAYHASTIHLLCFASWFGCSNLKLNLYVGLLRGWASHVPQSDSGMWVSFVAGLVMFHNLPRHVFGRLQAKLFPRYFQYSVIFIAGILLNEAALGLNLGGNAARNNTTSTYSGLDQTQRCNLLVILAILLVNLHFFEPKTTAVMYERHKVELRVGTGHEIGQLKPSDPAKANDPELVALTKTFGKLHGCSTSLNLIALCCGVWHICWLGRKMH